MIKERSAYATQYDVDKLKDNIDHRFEKVVDEQRTEVKDLSVAIQNLAVQFTRNNVIQEMLLKEFGELNTTVKKITEAMSTTEAIKKLCRDVWQNKAIFWGLVIFFSALFSGFSEGLSDFAHWLKIFFKHTFGS